MAAGRMVIAGWMPALDVNGLPIPNAQMYFYENNTTTLATVYADQALTVPLSNPVLANSSGQFPDIWADDSNLFSVTIDAPYGPPGQPFSFNNIGPATSANNTATNKADRDGSNIEVLPFRSSLGYGTAALLNVGTGPAQIPALGEDGKLPSSVLPENGSYQGSWDASTNTPEIVSGVGNNGDFYYVNVAGNTVIDGYPADPLTEQWEIGDQIRFSSVSETWERIPDAGAANKLDTDGANAPTAPAARDEFLANIGAASQALREVTFLHILDVVPQELWSDIRTPEANGNTTDMTPYFAAAAARMPRGGTISIEGCFLRVKTQLTLGPGISIYGGDKIPDERFATQGQDYRAIAPQIMTDQTMVPPNPSFPNHVYLQGGNIKGVLFRPFTFANQVYASKAAYISARNLHFNKTCVGHRLPGGSVDDCMFLGYNIGIDNFNIERPKGHNNKGHCNTLVNNKTITDWANVQNNHQWPFVSAHQTWSDAEVYRTVGAAHTGYDTFDWGQLFAPKAYGAQYGVDIRNSDNTSVLHFGIDDEPYNGTTAWFNANPNYGLRYTGTIRRASAVDGVISSQTYGVFVDMNATYGNWATFTNVRVVAPRIAGHYWVKGNAAVVGGGSSIYTDIGTNQAHMVVETTFGDLAYVGYTFENGRDVYAPTDADTRDVQVVACNYVNVTTRFLFTNQLQGDLYVRGDDTAKSGKNQARILIENRASTGTGTMSTGKMWGLKVANDKVLYCRDETSNAVAWSVDPTNYSFNLHGGRLLGTSGIGNDFFIGLRNAGSEPNNLGLRIGSSNNTAVTDVALLTGGIDRLRVNSAGEITMRNVNGNYIPLRDADRGGDIGGTTFSPTLANGDLGRTFRTANTATTTVTLPAVARNGARITFIQGSTGQISFVAASGATVRSFGSRLKSAGIYATVYAECNGLTPNGSAEWYLTGDLVA